MRKRGGPLLPVRCMKPSGLYKRRGPGLGFSAQFPLNPDTLNPVSRLLQGFCKSLLYYVLMPRGAMCPMYSTRCANAVCVRR